MKYSVATVKISGIAPLVYSRRHDAPKLEGESHEDYDRRTAMDKAHWSEDGQTLVIPAAVMKAALVGGASYAGEKIKGKGNKTWTGKFKAGTAIMADIPTNLSRDDVRIISYYCADGSKGGTGGKSLLRHVPQAIGWEAEFEIWILDKEITADKVEQMLELSGMFNGLGTWAPRVGGMNGRFIIESFKWQDGREFVPVKSKPNAPRVARAA